MIKINSIHKDIVMEEDNEQFIKPLKTVWAFY